MQLPRLRLTLLLGVIVAASISGCQRPLADRPQVAPSRVMEIRAGLSSDGSGNGGADVVEQDPTGWVTVSGSFRFASGDVSKIPAPSALEIDGDDAAVCRQNAVPMSETIVVDAKTGGLKNVVIFLSDDLTKKTNLDKWLHPSQTGVTEPVVFDQKDCLFLPHVVALQVSQPLEMRNSENGILHNTNLTETPFNKSIPPGREDFYTHREEQRLPYPAKCTIHSWMVGYILPRNNGYFAVTKDDGSFTIENLPAGVDLTLKIWHEKVGLLKSVKINGEATTLPKRGLVGNWPAGEKELKVVVDVQPFIK